MNSAIMTPSQLEFWRALLAPFPEESLSTINRGGKPLTYLDKRSIENRLDSVCGPHNWYASYTEMNRGLICHLTISCPMATPGIWVMITKDDGAGPEEMGSTNKQTGEWEPDVDNDVKSTFTNAFRRAAQDAWGIGRYLYRKGIPTWLDPSAQPTPMLDAVRNVAAQEKAAQPAPQQQAPAPAPADKKFDNFKIPRAGKSVFAWTKEMEKVFETKLTDGIANAGEAKGWGRTYSDWTQVQVDEIVKGCIGYIKTTAKYQGQFDHIKTDAPPTKAPEPVINPVSGINISDLRRVLMNEMKALIKLQTGSEASPSQLRESFMNIAPLCKTHDGKLGGVTESLGKLTDIVWINNMIAFVADQIELAANASDPGDDDIGF